MSACGAPEAGLYFRPDGLVTSCCSGWHVLGRVNGPDRRSLREIWDGEPRRELRHALDHDDFALGCFECGRLARAGRRPESLAAGFDRFERAEPRTHPALMDFALSNRCNLACVQCNGSFSSTIRAQRELRPALPPAYDDRFFAELDEFLPHLERAQFKGGEPFLAPENRRIWDRLLDGGWRPEICVTTNGTVWNDQVERYTAELGFDLIISVDGVDPGALAAVRVGIDPDRFWRNVDRFRSIARAGGRQVQLHFCLMSVNWAELRPFLATAERLEVDPHVIWVDGPGSVNLLTMPHEDLAEVARHLAVADGSGPELGATGQALWDDARGRVDDALAGASSALGVSPVAVSIGTRSDDERRWRQLVEGIAAVPAGSLLTVAYENDVIVSVDPEGWSSWLHPASWVGRGLDETMMAIAADAGATMRSEVESLEGGAHRVELSFELPDGVRRLVGVHAPRAGRPGASRLALAELR